MGYNTVIMFSNDAYDQFKSHPDETIENVLKAMNDVSEDRHHYGVGNHANPMKPMKPRHASHDTIYVHSGNTLVEMSSFSKQAENIMKSHPDFAERMINTMEYHLKELKKKLKEIKTGGNEEL